MSMPGNSRQKPNAWMCSVTWELFPGVFETVHSPPISPWDSRDWYASMELPPSWFVKVSAIWGECLNYRGEPEWGLGESAALLKPTSLKNPTEKQGDCEQSRSFCVAGEYVKLNSLLVGRGGGGGRGAWELGIAPCISTSLSANGIHSNPVSGNHPYSTVYIIGLWYVSSFCFHWMLLSSVLT